MIAFLLIVLVALALAEVYIRADERRTRSIVARDARECLAQPLDHLRLDPDVEAAMLREATHYATEAQQRACDSRRRRRAAAFHRWALSRD